MKTIQQLEKERQDKVSAIIERNGIIFAFSNEQFTKNRKEGVEYVCFGNGMLAPKGSIEQITDDFEQLAEEMKADLLANVPMEKFIAHELANYECYYTGEYADRLESIQTYYPHCTLEDVREVYLKNVEKYD